MASALTASGITATVVQASTVYVVDNTASSCSDTGLGNSSQPFCTIGAAAKKTQAGDTVVVAEGIYTGTSVNPANSGTATSPITFTADAGVTISGGTAGFALSGRSNIVINGFTITGTSSYGISVSGGGNVTISRNTVSYSGQPVSAKAAAGIYLNNVAGGVVSSNVSHDNSAHGILLTGTTTGVTVTGNTSYHNAYQYQRNANGIDDVAPGNSIIGNVTYANEDSGINIYTGGNNALISGNVSYDNGDHGIDDYNVTGGRIIGNTVYYNCTDGINVEGTSGSYLIENNVSVNNATGAIINPTPINPSGAYTNNCNRRTGDIGVYDSAPSTTTANYNLVWQTGSGPKYVWAGTAYNSQASLNAATGQEANGIFADPGFVNPAAWNFQLTEGSPAIDSADSGASGEQTTDVLGNSRVDDPRTANTGAGPRSYDDRGAYEFQPPGTVNGPAAQLSLGTPGSPALAVTADASASTAGTAPITSYTFNFGDGTTVGPQHDAIATHTYTTAGTYPVTVTVTDATGLTSMTTQSITVNLPPTAHMSLSPTSGNAPLAVTADASASTAGTAPIISYSFSFGDGTTVGPQAGATATQPVVVSAPPATAKYVNSIATNSSASTHTSDSLTVWRASGVAAGDLIVAVAQLTGTSATGAVAGTDSAGDTLTVASDISDGSGDRLVTLSGLAKSGLASGATITITFPSATSNRVTADEVSGVSTVDQVAAAGGPSGSFSSGATGTTARAGEFVLGATASFGGTSVGWDPAWKALTSYTTGSNALARAYQVSSSTGSFAATGTASGAWLSEVVAFS